MGDPADDLLECLGVAPPWQTAVGRAISLSRTDARAQAWMENFVARASRLARGAVPAGAVGATSQRFAESSAPAMPPELTAILREALGYEGPVLRAAVFMLVGAAVRAPLLPVGETAPWDCSAKLRIIGKALPAGRQQRWAEALPHVQGPPMAGALAGRRLIGQGFSEGGASPLRLQHALPPAVAVDLLLSALTFRACAQLADEALGEAVPRVITADITEDLGAVEADSTPHAVTQQAA